MSRRPNLGIVCRGVRVLHGINCNDVLGTSLISTTPHPPSPGAPK
jgi:hypothetical protein